MASGLFEFSRHLSSFWVRTGSFKKNSQISSCVDGATSDADHSKTREANFWEALYVSNDKESVLPNKTGGGVHNEWHMSATGQLYY